MTSIRTISARGTPGCRAARRLLVAACLLSLLALRAHAGATTSGDLHSANASEAARLDLGAGLTEVAFWDDLAVVGRFTGTGLETGADAGFSVVDISEPDAPVELSRFVCTGGGWDLSVWDDLVFLSVDGITSTSNGACDSRPEYISWTDDLSATTGFMGLKIVSIADPSNPVQAGSVRLPCSGSHTNTIIPDLENGRVLIYAASLIDTSNLGSDWPASEAAQGCDVIVEVPLADPAAAAIIGRLPSGEGKVTQCHDMTYFEARKLLGAACYSELRLYDVSDPEAPVFLSAVPSGVANAHSIAFSQDGNTLVLGEERGYSKHCMGGLGLPINGALWFYDITNPLAPVLHGFHALQRGLEAESPHGAGCSAHNFNIVPTRNGRDVLVAAWYAGGMSVVDFTDIDHVTEVAYYQPDLNDPSRRAFYWSAYWYRGHVYATNAWLSRHHTLDVYTIGDPAIGDPARLPYMNASSQEAQA